MNEEEAYFGRAIERARQLVRERRLQRDALTILQLLTEWELLDRAGDEATIATLVEWLHLTRTRTARLVSDLKRLELL